jgi:hypothetical protein
MPGNRGEREETKCSDGGGDDEPTAAVDFDGGGLVVIWDAEDALLEVGVFGRGEGEGWLLITGEGDEGFGVVGPVMVGLDDEVVAGFLAFLIETAAEESDGGMEEEEGFEEALEDDDKVIEAAEVGEFV